MNGLRLAQLIVTSLLFVGWLSWLAMQARTVSRIPVLSVAQAIQADADVLVRIADADGVPLKEVTVEQVLWTRSDYPLRPGETLTIPNLDYTVGYTTPGTYLVNLRLRDGQPRAALVGSSPGVSGWTLASRIYRWNEVIEKQWQRLRN
jgi:hypothetical protein